MGKTQMTPNKRPRKRAIEHTDHVIEAVRDNLKELGQELPPVPRSPVTGQPIYAYVHSFTHKGKEYKLTESEKRFADYYVASNGDRISAVVFAGYRVTKDPTTSKYSLRAYQLLRRKKISLYINRKLKGYGYNMKNVKKQHAFVLNQHGDLNAKNKAIDMFYKVTGGYAPEKHEHTIEKVEVVDYSTKKLKEEKEKSEEGVMVE